MVKIKSTEKAQKKAPKEPEPIEGKLLESPKAKKVSKKKLAQDEPVEELKIKKQKLAKVEDVEEPKENEKQEATQIDR